MADAYEVPRKLIGYLVTGIISLIVAVGGGYLVNYLTEKRMALEYEVVNSEAFSGQKQNIAIWAIDVRNSGKKELENLFCKIGFSDAFISEYKITGIPKSQASITQESNQFQIATPFINSGEKISVQLLLLLPSGQYQKPVVEVRSKGAVGVEIARGNIRKGSPKDLFIFSLSVGILALVPVTVRALRKFNPKMFYTKRHKDDQRDILAYIFSLNGFVDESHEIRNSSRELSYWSEADFLTQRCLRTDDEPTMRRAIKCLEDLMDYAAVADTSLLIINYNVARMAVAINDIEKAKVSLGLALKGKHKVIVRRINFDSRLLELYKSLYPTT